MHPLSNSACLKIWILSLVYSNTYPIVLKGHELSCYSLSIYLNKRRLIYHI
ncbi:hypothetical protein GLYMA_10G295550v4 [Glycine max]|nr:hypothetical protein GLYMA_10G295550v4 [Glycine max]KAH1140708.1 hypothetical protein GYH30_029536 [Glycine max]